MSDDIPTTDHLSWFSESADHVRSQIEDACPTWSEAALSAYNAVSLSVRLVIDELRHVDSAKSRAIQGVFVQAANDFMDLIVDASAGRGRPAMRAARSLVEEQIAAADIAADDESAERWLGSSPLVDVHLESLALPQDRLSGKDLKRYRHRTRRRSKAAEPRLRTAISRWGSRFRIGWHSKSLRDRAGVHGFQDAYLFYRVASAPVHGSGAGTFGLRKIRTDGPTVRTGVALEPVSLAVLYGTSAMRSVLGSTAGLGSLDLSQVEHSLDQLDEAWAELHWGLDALDERTWPKDAPVNRAVAVLVWPDGGHRFFEYLPEIGLVRRMRDDGMSIHDAQRKALDLVRETIASNDHGLAAVFVHEAAPTTTIPETVEWEPFPVVTDVEFHIKVDGGIGLASDSGHLGPVADIDPQFK